MTPGEAGAGNDGGGSGGDRNLHQRGGPFGGPVKF